MSSADSIPSTTGTATARTVAAYDVLQELLQTKGGIVSSHALRKGLGEHLNITDEEARAVFRQLAAFDEQTAREIGRPGAIVHHQGWNFYSPAKYEEQQQGLDDAATTVAEQEEARPEQPDAERDDPRPVRQEEAKVGRYVKSTLEGIYDSEFRPNEVTEYVFDVHNFRPGSLYENVDLFAVHWRARDMVELVAVEVKLGFSAKAVHQACNYARFVHRSWVAAVIEGDLLEAAMVLRNTDEGLFEYAVSRGIGILACRRSRGRSYRIMPVHWPLRNTPDAIELDRFKEQHRAVIEAAGVLPRQRQHEVRM